ncbi:MAG: hypothetical protein ACFCGT_03275 [Sandaracinaceae bacterium]
MKAAPPAAARVRTRARAFGTLAAVVLGVLAAGCEDRGGSLTGSLGAIYDTRFVTVRARLYESEVSAEYVRSDGTVPVRVTVDRSEVGLADGVVGLIELGQADVSGIARDGTPIPVPAEGEVTLDEAPLVDGQTLRGSFLARFPTRDRTFSLSGSFAAPLEVVRWEELGPEGLRPPADAPDLGPAGAAP